MSVDPPPTYQYQPVPSLPSPKFQNLDLDPTLEPEPTFELLLTLVHPSKRIRTPNRKTKNSKPESENKGPYEIMIETGWNTFLGIIAGKLSIERSDLVISSLEWHWLKPSSGPWLPVQDETGFASMLKKVKSKFEPYVIVRMQAPVKKKAAESSENTWDAVDEAESDFEDRPGAKKVKLDDVLEEIVIRLGDKYAPGMCSLHPDLPCFHHRASDLHFNLDRPRLLVWAQAIKSGSATYEKVPILSPMFKAQLALKRASQIATNSNTTVATGMTPPLPTPTPTPTTVPAQMLPFASFPHYPQMMFPSTYPQMPPMPPFMGYGAGMSLSGNPFFPTGPGMVSMPTQSPPSSPPTANCTVAHFCETYDLGEDTEVGLQKLGFRFGDDLTTLTPEEYTNAGFKPLEWRRVLKAYKRLKRDNRY